MENKTLIIKTGAAGDIVRTTVLLHFLHGEITWVVDKKNRNILPEDFPGLRILSFHEAEIKLRDQKFDLVISLEEDNQCALIAECVVKSKLIGVYNKEDKFRYTPDSANWFDMSLISALGKAKANELKKKNTQSFQNLMIEMLGYKFNSEPYCIYQNNNIIPTKKLAGIEKRVGNRWPNKMWYGYDELEQLLKRDGYSVIFFEQRENLRQYLDDINSCEYIISGDTLAMHVALAYKKPCIAIFNCTSPQEIYDYKLLEKVINPKLNDCYYSQAYSNELAKEVSVKEVYERFKKISAK